MTGSDDNLAQITCKVVDTSLENTEMKREKKVLKHYKITHFLFVICDKVILPPQL